MPEGHIFCEQEEFPAPLLEHRGLSDPLYKIFSKCIFAGTYALVQNSLYCWYSWLHEGFFFFLMGNSQAKQRGVCTEFAGSKIHSSL